MKLPDKIYYTEHHLWVEFSGQIATIGMTDFGQKLLGKINHVQVGSVGQCYHKSDVFGSVKTEHIISELSLPISGEIVEVNSLVETCSGIINDQPYTDGWVVKVKPTELNDREDLYISEEYRFLVSP